MSLNIKNSTLDKKRKKKQNCEQKLKEEQQTSFMFEEQYSPVIRCQALPCFGTKFRYIISGIPKNKKYTIEEARWSDQKRQFVSECIHVVTPATVKHWLGFIPASLGYMKITMWIYLPLSIFDIEQTDSPLKLWEENRNVFIPYSFDRLRHFPTGDCLEQASKIPTSLSTLTEITV